MNHDQLFKALLREFFIEFLEMLVPEAAAYVDAAHLEFLEQEAVSDPATGARHEADLVVKTRFKGTDAAFLAHVETQSSAEGDFARRMFRYFAALTLKLGLPVYPIALFSYDRPARPEPAEFRVTFPDAEVLRFTFRVLQLNRMDWRDFVRRPNPVAAALMAKMRIAPEDRPRVKLECVRMLVKIRSKLTPHRVNLVGSFFDTYLKLSADEERQYAAEVESLMPEEKLDVMQLPNHWIEEGMEKGMEKGLQAGRRATVLQQLRRRLGDLGTERQAQIEALSAARLDELTDAVFDLTTPGDLDRWLAERGEPPR